MTAKIGLEFKGIISAFPVAEILLEVSQAKLTGSLRIDKGDQKSVVYFVEGSAAYAVSNEKRFRLFKILLDQGLIDSGYLTQNRDVINDLYLAEKIEIDGKISRDHLQMIVSVQCESVIVSALTWTEGEWTFSPHARLKSGVSYKIDLANILMTYAREVASEVVAERIANPNEWFSRRQNPCDSLQLRQEEDFVLSRLDTTPMTLSQVNASIGDIAGDSLKTIYSLWLGGYLSRSGWPAAFSEERLSYLKSAKLELKRPAKSSLSNIATREPGNVVEHREPELAEADAPFDLDENLNRIESARNSYEVLGLSPSAKLPDIRKAYYRLAKVLHPDRYRREDADRLRRIEKAFTELAQAHESIKTPEARQSYDMRVRQIENERVSGDTGSGEAGKHGDQAAGDFQRGFALQLEGEFDAAVPFLARAAYYEPGNARYRAYYGKALSADDDQRHKAEKELVTAVQLEPGNATFRLMLAEFLVKYKLMKRAEGELNRLLEISPGHKDALRLLDRLQGK